MANGNYDDIINLPHHVSKTHPPMSRLNRAAQFAPFAALVGYDASVSEEARLTDMRLDITEEQITFLNRKIAYLNERLDDDPIVKITYFVPDRRKSGGKYVTVESTVHSIDDIEGVITLTDKKNIPMNDIIAIDGDIFAWDMFD